MLPTAFRSGSGSTEAVGVISLAESLYIWRALQFVRGRVYPIHRTGWAPLNDSDRPKRAYLDLCESLREFDRQ